MITVPGFRARKGAESRLVVLTAYDATTTELAEAAGVDALLVGDSLGMVVLGQANTLAVTMDDMLAHVRAVARRRSRALLIADMPWLSYHLGARDAVANAARFIREGGADAVKLEGGVKRLQAIRAILDAEIPVMGHLGLTPQSVLRMGGYKVQARRTEEARALVDEARALADAGVFSIVLEGIPGDLAAEVTESIRVPTIGIGAGVRCDGQVLVVHDLLGMLSGEPPKFVRRYMNFHEEATAAVRRWADDVRLGRFPSDAETYR